MYNPGKIAKTLCAAFSYVGVYAKDIAVAADVGRGLHMTTGIRSGQPMGHFEFCKTHPDECKAGTNQGRMTMNDQRWDQLITVNDLVNTTVIPKTDFEAYQREELWTYPVKVGDCEDYMLEKERWLKGMGWHQSQLLKTVVKQPNGDGHAVLTVRTNEGDFILDNLDPVIKRWDFTVRSRANPNGYDYVKRQSVHNPAVWYTIITNVPPQVASVSPPTSAQAPQQP